MSRVSTFIQLVIKNLYLVGSFVFVKIRDTEHKKYPHRRAEAAYIPRTRDIAKIAEFFMRSLTIYAVMEYNSPLNNSHQAIESRNVPFIVYAQFFYVEASASVRPTDTKRLMQSTSFRFGTYIHVIH